ncbi:MAG: pyridoxamine 5'-phosphate oxidase family protein [Caulobacterales bacterium]|jgi:general stress protein 26
MLDDLDGRDAAYLRLWDAVETRRIGMLGLTKSGLHAQPAIAFVERRRKRLWFIARTDSDLVRSIGAGSAGMFVLQDAELLVSIAGELSLAEDRRRMARYWTGKLAAWLPEGPGDPRLSLLRMDCVDAELWVAGIGLTKFAWEIAWAGAYPRTLDGDGQALATLH